MKSKLIVKISFLFLIFLLGIGNSAVFAEDGGDQQQGKVGPVEVTPLYSSQQVPTQQISNQRYSDFPVCPLVPQCPSKNEAPYQPGDPNYRLCPQQCTVTRSVNPDYGTGKEPQYQNVSSVINAVCPQGYAQVADYNLQREIIHDPSRTVVYPVAFSGQGGYGDLTSLGYDCSNLRIGSKPPDKWQCKDQKDGNPYQPILNQLQNIDGYAGAFIRAFDVGCYIAGCPGRPTECKFWYTFKKTIGTYAFYECAPPRNQLYYGSRYIPASIVCAQVRAVWAAPPT